MADLRILKMTGRCANGAERDKGTRWHAVPLGHPWVAALCGAQPGRQGNGWSEYAGDDVTCPRCFSRILSWPSAKRDAFYAALQGSAK